MYENKYVEDIANIAAKIWALSTLLENYSHLRLFYISTESPFNDICHMWSDSPPTSLFYDIDKIQK